MCCMDGGLWEVKVPHACGRTIKKEVRKCIDAGAGSPWK